MHARATASLPSESPSVLHRPSSALGSLAAILSIAAAAAAQTPVAPVPGNVPITQQVNQTIAPPMTGNFFDNTKGNLVRFQLSHMQPIAIDKAIGDYLFAPNNAGQRLTITYLPTNTTVAEIPTGPGITALADRPGTNEVWAVDSVNGCVSVIDPMMNRIVRTIPVGKEPHGIVILANGSRAYVTCSASNTVDVIDCTTYKVVKSLSIPAKAPRGITMTTSPDIVWVTPFYSGNNTVSKKTLPGMSGPGGFLDGGAQAVVTPNPALGEVALPDQDLFAIPVTASAANDVVDLARTRTGLGTILFNVHRQPGTSKLWIPNTDALNLIVGDANFQGGRVVANRITIVDTSTTPSTPPVVLDLDGMVAPSGAAQPAAIVFDTARNRAYVAAFGSDAILVLSAGATPTVIGRHTLTPRTPALPVAPNTPARCGPRGMAISANGNELYVFNGIDNSYSRVNLTVLNSTVPVAQSLGFDPTPDAVKRGLGHLANADHSSSKTSSCMSCHVDGHLDLMVWNLSAFDDQPGTANPQFEKDNKGPMATQTLRGLFETGVLHWRGEQAGLDDFNQDGFVGLMKRAAPLAAAEFAELKLGTQSLVHPANPREPWDRVLSGQLANGRDAFRTATAIAGFTCASCHVLPLGSTTELQQFITTASPAFSGKVAPLRGVTDKLHSTFTVFPAGYPSSIVQRTRNGFGLTHAGTVDTTHHFVSLFPSLSASQAIDIASFVDAFDTGLAPMTASQQTLVPTVDTAADFDAVLAKFRDQAIAGNCDVVVATAVLNGGVMVPVTLAWDHVLKMWQSATEVAAFSDVQLRQFTFGAGWITTFFGLPLGTGRRFGVDRDLDGLLDNDENSFLPFAPGNATNSDSDNDGFLDGHEAKNGMNPRVSTATSPDQTSPSFTSATTVPVTVVYVTATTAKLEFSTNEPTKAEVLGSFDATSSPTAGTLDTNHSILLRALPSGVPTPVTVRITDDANNTSTAQVTITTMPAQDGIRVVGITAVAQTATIVNVTVTIGSIQAPHSSLGVGDQIVAFAHTDGATPLATATIASNPMVAGPGKSAVFQVTIPAGPIGQRRLHFGVRSIAGNGSGLAYLEGKDILNYAVFTF